MAEITADMTITDVVSKYPATVDVFKRYGMHCFG
jgi:hybrid cluster-associated redox disulfide protein